MFFEYNHPMTTPSGLQIGRFCMIWLFAAILLSACDAGAPAVVPTTPDGAAPATAAAAQTQAIQTAVAIQLPVQLTAIALSATATPTSSATATATATPAPSATPSATASATATATQTPLPAPTETRAPVAAATAAPTVAPPANTPAAPALSGQLAIPICVNLCKERNDREVVLVTLGGAVPAARTMARAATDPSFQPDGKRVLFRSLATSQEGRGEGVFIYDEPSGAEIRVDGGTDDYSPVFINNGRVLFSSTRVEELGKQEYRLFIASRYNSDDVPIGVGPDTVSVLKDARFPAATGGLIAYNGCVGGGCGIWTTTERGYAPRDACCQIASGASDTAPDWSPDGTRLAFTSHEDGNFEIYMVAASGAGRTRLTRSSATNVAPTWSPDGQWIAFLSDRGGGWAVWLLRADRPDELLKLYDIPGVIDDGPSRRMDWAVSP